MYFLSLCIQNVTTRKVRALLTGLTIAISIATVVTMGVLTESLRNTAISVLQTGKADFSIAQKGLSDVIYSSLDQKDLEDVRSYDGVQSAVGVLVAPVKLDDQHPFFLQLGLQPEQLNDFGVEIVAGQAYDPGASDQLMLGYRAAREFGKTIGDQFDIDGRLYRVTGIYRTGQVFGDEAAMFPLTALQAEERKPGTLTLIFVRVAPGTNIDALRAQIEADHPELATVKTESDFGRVDRNLALISAANVGVSLLALIIGAVTVMNTMLLTVFERTREFGVLRAIGWGRVRVLASIMIEALIVSFAGAALGIGLAFFAIQFLGDIPDLVGVFHPAYPSWVFGRALLVAFGVAVVGRHLSRVAGGVPCAARGDSP